MKACALLVFVVAVVAAAEAKRIQLRDTSIGVDTVPTISQLPHRIAALQRDYDADTHHQFFVHLDGPLTLDQRRAIERDYDIDFPVHFYFPEHSFLITTTIENALRLERAPHVLKVIEYEPQHRIAAQIKTTFDHSEQQAKEHQTTIILADSQQKDNELFIISLSRSPQVDAPRLALKWNRELSIRGLKATVQHESNRYLVAAVPWLSPANKRDVLEYLASQPYVHWIEPKPILQLHNRDAAWILQSNMQGNTPLWSHGLTGQGQIIGVADSGVDVNNCMFYDPSNPAPFGTTSSLHRKIFSYWKNSNSDYTDDADGHGTHVSGSVLGAAMSSSQTNQTIVSAYNGMAYDARLAFYDAETTGDSQLTFPVDLQAGLFNLFYSNGVRLQTNSWGCGNPDITVCNSYNSQAKDVDEFMYNNPTFLILFAAGNSGSDGGSSNPNGWNTVGYPSTAKNCLTVGATFNAFASWQSVSNWIDYYDMIQQLADSGYCTMGVDCPATPNDCCNTAFESVCCPTWLTPYVNSHPSTYRQENLAAFSSRGPATGQTNRIKPDVVAPGYQVVSAHGSGPSSNAGHCALDPPNYGNDAALLALLGTSMATPVIAGTAALVRQYFVNGYYPSGSANAGDAFVPSAALIKAVVVNSANALTGVAYVGNSPVAFSSFTAAQRYWLQGFGRPLLANVLRFSDSPPTRQLFVVDDTIGVDQGDTVVAVSATTATVSTGQLSVTLAWTDPAASPNSAGALTNNLDLVVVVGSTSYYGNADYTSPPDTENNVERVTITVPSGSTQPLEVRVIGQAVNAGPQPFALVVSGNFARSTGTTTTANGQSTATVTTAKSTNTNAATTGSTGSTASTGPEQLVTITGSSYNGTTTNDAQKIGAAVASLLASVMVVCVLWFV